jgi:signal transduction histidine kinase
MENEKKLSFAGLPMRVHDRVIGILVIVRENGEQVILEEMTLLSFIADHLALVVENARLYQRAEKIAVMEERSRLARELHDSVTQNLFSANLHIAGAQKYASLGNYPKVDSSLNQIGQLTQQALIDLRLMVYELRASEIIQHGLISALQNRLDAIERRSNIEVEIDMTWLNPLPEQIEENLYRIAVEALNNSLKHARASKVKVEFTRVDNSLLLAVQDNGAGLEVNTALLSGGFGLTTMRQRTDRMGGSFKVISNPGNGTRIEVKIPIPENLDLKERGRDDQ